MLERVALGQTRFRTPGVSPDSRGVVLGRHMILALPTLEGVVTWLRLYSAEESVDELVAGLELFKARTSLGTQLFLAQIPVLTSYTADTAARFCRLAGGTTFTGTSRHFVRFRDDKSPYGYDATDIKPVPEKADFVLHDLTFEQSISREGTIELLELIQNLTPRRQPVTPQDFSGGVFLAVREGLGAGIIRYLYRNGAKATVALVTPEQSSVFEQAHRYLLVRIEEPEQRIISLFIDVPGISVFVPNGSRSAVELGYAHLITLESCETVFAARSLSLFWGSQGRVDAIDDVGTMASVKDLAKPKLAKGDVVEIRHRPQDLDAVRVPLYLGDSVGPPARVSGSLVPTSMADLIKRVVYFLPGPQLRAYQIAATDMGFIIRHENSVDPFPLGTPLWEFAPGVFLPVGAELLPKVTAAVAAQYLGHEQGQTTVFTRDGNHFRIANEWLVTLERGVIAQMDVEKAVPLDLAKQSLGAPEVRNDDLGRFALWGIPSLDSKALPAPVSDD